MSDYLLNPFGKPDAGRFMRAIDGFTLDYTCSPMADILGLGLSHYPPLCLPDADMSSILRWTLQDSSIPAREKDVANWPAPMREEWSSDQGTRAAAEHRKQLIAGFDKVRAALDAFQPDVVVIWGDDQYENFREDVIPPFAILAYDDLDLYPWGHAQASSSWWHAFLCDPTWRLRPDTPADRRLYEAMRAGDYDRWRTTSLQAVEDAGQQEVLNWFALAGAMQALGARLEWSEFVETHIFNSNKVFAVYAPA